MLTAMKLTGKPDDIVAYHSREENYYFSQLTLNKAMDIAAGNCPPNTEPLDYISVHGNLCKTLQLNEGQNINESTFKNLLNGRNSKGEKISRAHKTTGIDLTFSAPKSASISALINKDKRITEKHKNDIILQIKNKIIDGYMKNNLKGNYKNK